MQTNVTRDQQDLPFELLALQNALRYQEWIFGTIKPYLGNRILELGAGIGNMSQWFNFVECLIMAETNEKLLPILEERIKTAFFDMNKVKITSHDIAINNFDCFIHENINTIISFNVLEHIENDVQVLKNCVNLLRKSSGKKRIISFVPAHQWAYGEADKNLGHYRRYNKNTFQKLHEQTAPDAKLIMKSFNFVGLWGWFFNGRVLRRSAVGSSMIHLFEKLCPAIKFTDKIIVEKMKLPLGQSLIAIQEFD